MSHDAFNEFMRVVVAACPPMPTAQFALGQIVRSKRRLYRGVVFDADPTFCDDEVIWARVYGAQGIDRDQPFYSLICDSADGEAMVAYVPEALLEPDDAGQPISNPKVSEWFTRFLGDRYAYTVRHDA